MNAEAADALAGLAGGDVSAIVRLHATTGFRSKWDFQFGFFGRGFQTFGLFLLGLWAGRHRVFEDRRDAQGRCSDGIWRWSGALALADPGCSAALSSRGPRDGRRVSRHRRPGTVPGPLELAGRDRPGVVRRVEQRDDALLHGVVRVALPSRALAHRGSLVRDRSGRMALSVYVSAERDRRARLLRRRPRPARSRRQHGDHADGPRRVRVAGLGVSRVARAFRFGPLEWAWRSLTWLRREPFRRAGTVRATNSTAHPNG